MTVLLLSGLPGIGKTTIVEKVAAALEKERIPHIGFVSRERRSADQRRRIGFDLHILQCNGPKDKNTELQLPACCPLATLIDEIPPESSLVHNNQLGKLPRVGRYAVHVREFESFIQTCFSNIISLCDSDSVEEQPIVLIDEIGKMECFSEYFMKEIRMLLDNPGISLLSTIALKGHRFIDEVFSDLFLTCVNGHRR
jgi:nucleoside-triphosphatase